MKKYIIEPLNKEQILEIFDKKAIEIINYYLKINTFSHPESKQNQENISFQVTKEHLEQWVVQALDAKPMGSGSYPIDIKTDRFLADIKSMSIKTDKKGNIVNSESGETSLAQKFREKNLDEYFNNQEYNHIKNLWVKILLDKYKSVIEETKINDIYFIFFMRADIKYYMFITKINYNLIDENNIQVNEQRTTNDSVYLKNIINDEFGSTKIYKAKKRLELRLLPKKFIDNDYFYLFDTLKYPEKKDLRKIDIIEHIKYKVTKFFLLL